jgi:hypothetical protein
LNSIVKEMPLTTIVLTTKGDVRKANLPLEEGLLNLDILQKYLRKKDIPEDLGTLKTDAGLLLTLFGYTKGKAGTENKTNIGIPSNTDKIFGDILVIAHRGEWINPVSFSPENWEAFQEGEKDEEEDEDEEDEEIDESQSLLLSAIAKRNRQRTILFSPDQYEKFKSPNPVDENGVKKRGRGRRPASELDQQPGFTSTTANQNKWKFKCGKWKIRNYRNSEFAVARSTSDEFSKIK